MTLVQLAQLFGTADRPWAVQVGRWSLVVNVKLPPGAVAVHRLELAAGRPIVTAHPQTLALFQTMAATPTAVPTPHELAAALVWWLESSASQPQPVRDIPPVPPGTVIQ